MFLLKNFIDSIENRFVRIKLSIIIFFIIGAGFYYLLAISWLRWGNLLVDTSRELWLPSQLIRGKILYKDLAYPFGFLPPYFLALLYKIFGVHINTLVGCGIGITVLISIFLNKISRFFVNEIISGLITLTFLFVFAFGYYQPYSGLSNFILPYSFASTFFILFVTIALYSFLKFILSGLVKYLFFWCSFLSLAFLSRPDMTLPVWLGFLLAGAIYILKNKERKIVFHLLAPLFIAILIYFLFLYIFGAFPGFNESIVGALKTDVGARFIFMNLALDNLSKSAFLVIKSFALHCILIFLLGLAVFLVYQKKRGLIWFLGGMVIIFLSFWFSQRYFINFIQYRCIPLVLLIGMLIALYNVIRSPDFKENLALLTLFLISLTLILRIFLNTTPIGHGFYLLILALVCYYVFFLKLSINLFSGFFKDRLRLLPGILIYFFLILILPYWASSFYWYKVRHVELITSKGKFFYLPDDMTKIFWQTVTYLEQNTLESDKVVVLPDGVSLNFFSGRDNPLRYYQFFSSGPDEGMDNKMILELARFNVDYIVLVQGIMEPDHPFFGVDYGQKLASWIQDNYTMVKRFGSVPFTSDECGIVILKRKN